MKLSELIHQLQLIKEAHSGDLDVVLEYDGEIDLVESVDLVPPRDLAINSSIRIGENKHVRIKI